MNNGKENLRQKDRYSLRAAGRLLSAVLKASRTAEGRNWDMGCGCPVDTSAAGRSTDRADRRDQRHLRYIKQHHKIRYTNLLTNCKLTAYLADIDEQAEEMFFRLVKQLAEKEGVTEQLKAENQMLWGAGLRWRPLPQAEAPTEPTGETTNEQYP